MVAVILRFFRMVSNGISIINKQTETLFFKTTILVDGQKIDVSNGMVASMMLQLLFKRGTTLILIAITYPWTKEQGEQGVGGRQVPLKNTLFLNHFQPFCP